MVKMKYPYMKIFLFVAIPAVVVGYFLFQGLYKNENSRVPAAISYPINTAEIEARSKRMMEEGRRLHAIEDYSSANKTLSGLLKQYPYTGYMEEASFLLAKGLFYEEQFTDSEKAIQRLREYDPSSKSKWVGYSLLIKAKLHTQRGEIDESVRLYRHVIKEFPDKDLVNEAEDLLMEMSF